MAEEYIRKFRDLAIDKKKKPKESKVQQAFRLLRASPHGETIELYLLSIMAQTVPPDVSESAWREIEAERRMARRIVRMMNEPEPKNDGSDDSDG